MCSGLCINNIRVPESNQITGFGRFFQGHTRHRCRTLCMQYIVCFLDKSH